MTAGAEALLHVMCYAQASQRHYVCVSVCVYECMFGNVYVCVCVRWVRNSVQAVARLPRSVRCVVLQRG